ncbi:type II secretion system protein [bacterium]|nr:MAG: type II secretion system protein [bacterium]
MKRSIHATQSGKNRKQGFTLIEILVVLVIASIISSITFGAFRSISEGNRRTNCQSNLSQIYQSCRQYAQDFDNKFPYLNSGTAATDDGTANSITPKGGIGLWGLYVFPPQLPVDRNQYNCDTANVNLPPVGANQLTGYIRSTSVFHCPSDNSKRTIKYNSPACTTQEVDTGVISFQAGSDTWLNPSYLSYQVGDDVPNGPTNRVDTYSSFREADPSAFTPPTDPDNANYKPVRQLVPFISTSSTATAIPDRPTRSMTVVTWCRFHRRIDSATNTTLAGRRNYDNVLFSDGSVQNLPAEQTVTQGATTATCTGWERVPRAKADNMKSATECIPTP